MKVTNSRIISGVNNSNNYNSFGVSGSSVPSQSYLPPNIELYGNSQIITADSKRPGGFVVYTAENPPPPARQEQAAKASLSEPASPPGTKDTKDEVSPASESSHKDEVKATLEAGSQDADKALKPEKGKEGTRAHFLRKKLKDMQDLMDDIHRKCCRHPHEHFGSGSETRAPTPPYSSSSAPEGTKPSAPFIKPGPDPSDPTKGCVIVGASISKNSNNTGGFFVHNA
ncbi:hypothetical protein NLJ89_g7058 [Agrocybe chaxingu]|uniref:Uncharacterized protein n=1 Tax=Agrocybe chaxingu TaxID=84603 RepID=A0A9W8MVE9_9AGAR|nr:hypothetical protein NLJ89_g7058 [Agrocybe chaxingu]